MINGNFEKSRVYFKTVSAIVPKWPYAVIFNHLTKPIPRLSLNKRALWLVDSWSRAPDQIQMYPNRDTIAQLLPARRMQQLVFAIWLFKRKSKYITKHLMYDPSGN